MINIAAGTLLALVLASSQTIDESVVSSKGRVASGAAGTLANVAPSSRYVGRLLKGLSGASGYTGKGVTVALIDSGVDTSHPDLKGAVVTEACFCVTASGAPCCPDGTKQQLGPSAARYDVGHGTAIAGIIAGRGRVAPKGIAPQSKLIAVRVADAQGRTSAESMIQALDWLIASHPEVRVVNMSLGTFATYPGICDSASAITKAFAERGRILRERGTTVVAAAGNDARAGEIMVPACVSAFLSVGAVYTDDGQTASYGNCSDVAPVVDQVACFSNSSIALDLLAPGTGVVSSYPGKLSAIGSGTSQATAVVSGAAALLAEARPTPAAGKIEDALRSSGAPIRDSRTGLVTARLSLLTAIASLKAY